MALKAAVERLRDLDAPRAEAERLLAHVLGCDRSLLVVRDTPALSADVAARFEALVERRAAGEPLAYLTGTKGFWTLALRVTPDVLVPRPETELLVEWALENVPAPGAGARIIDLGTGSGAVALAVAKERPSARVTATDRSPEALAVARGNAEDLGLDVAFTQQDFFEGLPEREAFDLILSNPPYVAEGDPHLADLRFEPAVALTSGRDGLDALRAIASHAPAALKPGGWLIVEHGADQGAAVRALFGNSGLRDVQTRRDLAGHERCTGGRR